MSGVVQRDRVLRGCAVVVIPLRGYVLHSTAGAQAYSLFHGRAASMHVTSFRRHKGMHEGRDECELSAKGKNEVRERKERTVVHDVHIIRLQHGRQGAVEHAVFICRKEDNAVERSKSESLRTKTVRISSELVSPYD